jgi:hypothetical protein
VARDPPSVAAAARVVPRHRGAGRARRQRGTRHEERRGGRRTRRTRVAEAAIDRHEEQAERFLGGGIAVLLLAFAPLLAGRLPRAGGIAAYATIAASVGVLALGWAVGSTGGKLVYRDGAAAAWTGGALNAQQPVDATHREH